MALLLLTTETMPAVTDPTKCEVITEMEGTRAVIVGQASSLMIQAKDQLGSFFLRTREACDLALV
jgi:hypothetical protein